MKDNTVYIVFGFILICVVMAITQCGIQKEIRELKQPCVEQVK